MLRGRSEGLRPARSRTGPLAIACLLVVLVLLVGLATRPGWWLVLPAAVVLVLGGMLARWAGR